MARYKDADALRETLSVIIENIGNHKRLFMRQAKLVSRGEQLQYLDKRMAEIFLKDGFPQKFIDDMLGEVEVRVE